MKPMIYGIKKDNKRTAFVLEKSQEFIKSVRKIAQNLTGDNNAFDYQFIEGKEDKEWKIKDHKDICIYEKFKGYEFEVFIGKNRIILVIWTSLKNQNKATKEVIKFYKWYKK